MGFEVSDLDVASADMAVYTGPSDDYVLSLQAAATALGPMLGHSANLTAVAICGPKVVSNAVTALAEDFVRWLRRPAKLKVGPAVIYDQDTGRVICIIDPGGNGMADAVLNTDDFVQWDLDPEDNRGFNVDTTFDVTLSADNVVTATILPRDDTHANYRLQATPIKAADGGVAGPVLITVTVPDTTPLIVIGLAANIQTGEVAILKVGEPQVFPQEPPVTPEP